MTQEKNTGNLPLPGEFKDRMATASEIRAMAHRAETNFTRGNYTGALAGSKELGSFCRERNNDEGVALSLRFQGSALEAMGDYDGAIAAFRESESMDRRTGNKEGLGSSLYGRALTIYNKGERDEALSLCKESEALARAVGDKALMLKCLVLASTIHAEKGMASDASGIPGQARRFAAVYNLPLPADIRAARHIRGIEPPAIPEKAAGKKARKSAMSPNERRASLEEKERTSRANNDRAALANVLVELAGLYFSPEVRNYGKVLPCYEEAERLAREDGNLAVLRNALEKHARIREDARQFAEAMALYKELGDACTSLKDMHGLSSALEGSFRMAGHTGNADDQKILYKKIHEHYLRVGDWAGAARMDEAMGDVLSSKGSGLMNLSNMFYHYGAAEQTSRKYGLKGRLATSLWKKGDVLYRMEQDGKALAAYDEAGRIMREIHDPKGLVSVLQSKLLLLKEKNDTSSILPALTELEHACAEAGNIRGLCDALRWHGTILLSAGPAGRADYVTLLKACDRMMGTDWSRSSLAVFIEEEAYRHFTCDPPTAVAIYDELDRIYRELDDQASLLRVLGNLEILLRGDKARLGALYASYEQLFVARKNWALLQQAVERHASALARLGFPDEAEALPGERAEKYRRDNNLPAYIAALNARCTALKGKNDVHGLLQAYEALESAYRTLEDHNNTACMLGLMADLYYTGRDFDRALELCGEEARLSREKGLDEKLGDALCTEGNVYYSRNDLERALAIYDESESIFRKIGNAGKQLIILGNKENVLKAKKDQAGLVVLYSTVEGLCRTSGDRDRLRSTLEKHSVIAYSLNDIDKALEMTREALAISREQGNKANMQLYLGNLGMILRKKGDPDGALQQYKEQETLCAGLNNNNALAKCLIAQSSIYMAKNERENALGCLCRSMPPLKETGDQKLLNIVLAESASVLLGLGRHAEALALLKEQEPLCRAQNDRQRLLTCFTGQGSACMALKNWEGALYAYKGWEQIYREANVPEGLISALNNQAIVLVNIGRLKEALDVAVEAHALATAQGRPDQAQKFATIIEKIKSRIKP